MLKLFLAVTLLCAAHAMPPGWKGTPEEIERKMLCGVDIFNVNNVNVESVKMECENETGFDEMMFYKMLMGFGRRHHMSGMPMPEGEGEPWPEGEGEHHAEGHSEHWPEGEAESWSEEEGEHYAEGESEPNHDVEGEPYAEGEGWPEAEGDDDDDDSHEPDGSHYSWMKMCKFGVSSEEESSEEDSSEEEESEEEEDFGIDDSQPDFCRKGHLPDGPGIQCAGFFTKWTYSYEDGHCVNVTYGGCGGTENLFDTEEECETTCHVDSIEDMEPEKLRETMGRMKKKMMKMKCSMMMMMMMKQRKMRMMKMMKSLTYIKNKLANFTSEIREKHTNFELCKGKLMGYMDDGDNHILKDALKSRIEEKISDNEPLREQMLDRLDACIEHQEPQMLYMCLKIKCMESHMMFGKKYNCVEV